MFGVIKTKVPTINHVDVALLIKRTLLTLNTSHISVPFHFNYLYDTPYFTIHKSAQILTTPTEAQKQTREKIKSEAPMLLCTSRTYHNGVWEKEFSRSIHLERFSVNLSRAGSPHKIQTTQTRTRCQSTTVHLTLWALLMLCYWHTKHPTAATSDLKLYDWPIQSCFYSQSCVHHSDLPSRPEAVFSLLGHESIEQ